MRKREKDEFAAYFEESIPKEKVSAKRIIIYVVGILFILAIPLGIYLSIIGRDFLISLIPITRDENGNIVFKSNKDKDDKTSSEDRSKLVAPVEFSLKGSSSVRDFNFSVGSITVDDKSMYVTLNFENATSGNVYFECEKMLVEGFPLSPTFSETIAAGQTKDYVITIPKTELDALDIYQPEKFTLYIYTYSDESEKSESPKAVYIVNTYTTAQKEIAKDTLLVGEIGNVKSYFYKKVSDSSDTYIYFYFSNSSGFTRNVYVKKLLINGELYDASSFKVELYKSSKAVEYIKIPKDEYEEVSEFTISFFITGEFSKDNSPGVYVTNDFTSSL